MTFNLSSILAHSWGLDPDSQEFKDRRAKLRARTITKGSSFQMAPCGPACPVCGDNSYECGCASTSPQE